MPTPTRDIPTIGGRDRDGDGLIEVSNVAQLNAIRWDSDGNGSSTDVRYAAAFPNAIADMGCPDGSCDGYELVANLDFDINHNAQVDEGDAYWNDGSGWDPVSLGPSTSFEGNGYVISNLYINRPDANYVGLFGQNYGIIKNVNVEVNVIGTGNLGGLVGNNTGIVSDSSASGVVTGNGSNVGGLVGNNTGIVSDSSASGAVTGNGSNVGGLVGNNNGIVGDSSASGVVTGNGNNVGGLAGNNTGIVGESSASSEVTSKGNNVGGLVGKNTGIIGESSTSGAVMGHYNVGGLVGHNAGVRGNFQSAVIENSSASGNVTGVRHLGELVGRNIDGTISNSQGTGTVTQSK